MYDLIVIGAGASGLLAAAMASANNADTIVLERNNAPAKKILATGNGHCNYLNGSLDDAEYLRTLLESIGIYGTADESGRYYPKSREASFVADALVSAAKRAGAALICDCHITDAVKTKDGFKAVSKDGRVFLGKNLIIATGGKAGIQFGCYGEGYRWAQYMGHSLVKPVPALVPLECEEDITDLHGVRVRGKASLLCNGEILACEEGEIQFTKDSISGICVMDLSRNVRLGEGKKYELSVDLFPELKKDELDGLISLRKAFFDSGLEGLVPKKMVKYISERKGKSIAALSKDLRFSVKGTRGWADAQVTSGGVPLDELDMETMGSKKVPGLYFIGEMIDYDGPCGGFNLANAWRTAALAAKAATKAE